MGGGAVAEWSKALKLRENKSERSQFHLACGLGNLSFKFFLLNVFKLVGLPGITAGMFEVGVLYSDFSVWLIAANKNKHCNEFLIHWEHKINHQEANHQAYWYR